MKVLQKARSSAHVPHRTGPFFSPNRNGGRVTRPFFQPKLKIGAPGDRFEREADAVADQVVSRGTAPPVQRMCSGCSEEAEGDQLRRQPIEEEQLQAKADPVLRRQPAGDPVEEEEQALQAKAEASGSRPGEPPAIQAKCAACESEQQGAAPLQAKAEGSATARTDLAGRLRQHSGRGRPLPGGTRGQLESAFQADFGRVRVHTHEGAVQMNQDLKAQAFTHGRDVYFNRGKFNPDSGEGKRLLAHELTHVLQQNGRASRQVQRQPKTQPAPRTDKRVAACMADRRRLLPGGVGLLTHIMRESQLSDALGNERSMLEAQIQANDAARRFVCEAGVPAMIALYDTRRARIHLEVECARRALRQHPTHYDFAALRLGRRHLVLPPAFGSFRRRTPLFRAATGRQTIASLEVGRRLQLLSPSTNQGRLHVRVISGPHHCEEGFVKAGSLITPQATSIAAPRRVRLVFMENPERIGRTIMEVRAGITSRATRLRVPRGGGRRDRILGIPKRRKFYVHRSGHTDTELHVNMHVGSGRLDGFLPRAHTKNDLDFRRSERRFFVQIASKIARERSAVFVDPESQTCIAKPHPIEFFTGQDIARGIVGAANCTDALVDEIHIVGHGGVHGMPGTGDFADYTGLYVQQLQHRVEKRSGAMTAKAFVKAIGKAVANGVQVWIHACKTAENYEDEVAATASTPAIPRTPGFAEQLAGELRTGGAGQATVGALPGRGRADAGYRRTKRFVVYPGGAREFIKPI